MALRESAHVTAPRPAPGAAPTVSVVIPCYNYATFLPEALDSALRQEGVELEVIVVDDASSDDSADVAEKYAANDPRVRVIRLERNGGQVAAVNLALSKATGEFIVRLDADDLLTPGSLARSTALLRANPSVGLVYGYPKHFEDVVPAEVPVGPAESWSIWKGADWAADRCVKGYNCITTPEVVLRATALAEAGEIDARLRIAEDMHWWLRFAAVSDVGRVNGPVQALHRDHHASMTATVDKLRDLNARKSLFTYYFEGLGRRLPDAARLDRAWRRALAAEATDEALRAFDRGRTGTVDVEGFLAFAAEVWPDAATRPRRRALAVRRAAGPRLAPLMPTAFGAIVRRRIAHEIRYRRWTKRGV
jgi:glycosyltransferase involved in cell wall biosynthesis